MVERIAVKGYEVFKETVAKLGKEKRINAYFTGDKNEEGISWCPDCNKALDAINKAVDEFAPKDSIFMTVEVGDQPFWKDLGNPFRKDPALKLLVIPTLIRLNSVQRLEGSLCEKLSTLELFFTDE